MNYGKKWLKKLARKLEQRQYKRELAEDVARLQQRCRGVRADGEPCQAQPLTGGSYCRAHVSK